MSLSRIGPLVSKRASPYIRLARLDRPAGISFLYLPCTWSILMASTIHGASVENTIKTLGIFGVGAIIMRGAGCTINDFWDRDFDKKVNRTQARPLAAGELSPQNALGFLGLQLGTGLGILLQLNTQSILLGASSLIFVGIYPLMKRFTYFPQLFLGLTFNWGALLGFTAVTGNLPSNCSLALYAGGITWTLVYDTIYAHQDKFDDIKIGVRSTALAFGSKSKSILRMLTLSTGLMWTISGLLADLGSVYYISVAGSTVHLLWTVNNVDYDDPISCGNGFKRASLAGVILATGLAVEYLGKLPKDSNEEETNKLN